MDDSDTSFTYKKRTLTAYFSGFPFWNNSRGFRVHLQGGIQKYDKVSYANDAILIFIWELYGEEVVLDKQDPFDELHA